jgi:hypothetical protein
MNATSNVLGLVLTKAHARCLVQHHATAFLAIEDAKESWIAVIDVQASAERNALLSIVRNAATRKRSRSTYWRISPIEKLILTRTRSFFLDVDTSSLEGLSIPFLEWAGYIL